MTAAAAIELVMQLLALFPTIEPAAVKAVTDLKALVAGDAQPSQAEIDALIERVKAQSAEVQSLT